MTPKELIDNANSIPFMSWKAQAKAAIGDGAPDSKVDLIEALRAMLPEEVEEETAAPSGAVEVNLLKKYAPFRIMNDDGIFIDQGEVKIAVPAGIAYLEKAEAQRVLERGQASPTANTFAQMGA